MWEYYQLAKIEKPKKRGKRVPVELTDQTMEERLDKVIEKMKEEDFDVLVIYGDLEHGSNFEYLTGFLTRFEEGILVLHKNREAYLLLGNENTKMVQYSRIPAKLIHVPFFSLPDQPMEDDEPVEEYFRNAGIKKGQKTGLVGWKCFTSRAEDNRKLYDLPFYLVEAVGKVAGISEMYNASYLFIGENGARQINNANEIAHYEFGSALAGDCMRDVLDHIEPGMTEMALGTFMNRAGQKNSVITITAFGERFRKANLYPGEKKLETGDKVSLTVGYKGGLSSRAGYAVKNEDQLPLTEKDYVKQLAGPYFMAVAKWLETIKTGMTGGELYQCIEDVLPKEEYNWFLNPGHLTADEEWLASPVYPGSHEILRSGMLFQIDIIPKKKGYGGCGCEDGIALADQKLREQIQKEDPGLYQVFEERRAYIRDVLNIDLSEDVLPMNDMVAYCRPYLLDPEHALKKST